MHLENCGSLQQANVTQELVPRFCQPGSSSGCSLPQAAAPPGTQCPEKQTAITLHVLSSTHVELQIVFHDAVFVWYKTQKGLNVSLHPDSTAAVGRKVLPAHFVWRYSLLPTPLIASAATLSKCL